MKAAITIAANAVKQSRRPLAALALEVDPRVWARLESRYRPRQVVGHQ